MSGAILAGAGACAAGGESRLVTIGTNGVDFGYTQALFGAVSPSAALKSINVPRLATNSTNQFIISVSGTRAQNFFRGLLIQKTDGTFIQLMTSAAVFTIPSDSQWVWNTGSLLWTSTGVSPRAVQYLY